MRERFAKVNKIKIFSLTLFTLFRIMFSQLNKISDFTCAVVRKKKKRRRKSMDAF